uniref:Uridylate-specific endoribonuclease n=1 Tax=Sinocyclocheilus grahami TaxID=75366 RepID=A0A672PKZ3_SINGR
MFVHPNLLSFSCKLVLSDKQMGFFLRCLYENDYIKSSFSKLYICSYTCVNMIFTHQNDQTQIVFTNKQKWSSVILNGDFAHLSTGFMKLLDNYERSTGVAERVTAEEVTENNSFLDAVLETAVMKGKSRSDLRPFKSQLYYMWFRLYHRDRNGGEDSSGFEHVFVGETKFGREIMGLHNWVQFYLQEKQELLDYKGYKARDNDPNEDDHVLNVQFSWHGLVKPVASAFVGVSPEFEMAIFTILFLTSTEKTTTAVVNLDEYQLEMVVHRHGRSIGTAYPKLLSSNNRHV